MSPNPRLSHEMSSQAAPRPITDFLSDFDAPASGAAPAGHPARAATRMEGARSAPHAAPHATPPPGVPAPANEQREPGEDALARAFAAGKEEGLKLAEARAALERRRGEVEAERRSAERIGEAETRIGAMLAERLEREVAALAARVEADMVRCLVPIAGDLAERAALDALAREAASVGGAARWSVTGPDRLVDAFLTRLPEETRTRVDRRAGEWVDLTVTIDAATFETRLAALRDALGALGS